MLKTAIAERIHQQTKHQLIRTRRVRSTAQSVIVDGGISFNSNDYLGLANHPAVVTAFKSATDKYGVGSGSAHTISGHTAAHHALETQIAEWTGRERAITFSSGYMANIGIVQALASIGDVILQDRLNHASLLDSGQFNQVRSYRYRHNDMNDCEHHLKKHADRNKFILTDAVFSMDGDIAPLKALSKIARKYEASLMIDDAHGIGIYGHNGSGTANHLDLTSKDIPIMMGTLGKAVGCMGAFVAGDAEIIEACLQFSRTYLFTTAMPPAIAAAASQAIEIIQTQPALQQQLFDNINYFRTQALAAKLPLIASSSAIQPIIIGESKRALQIAEKLNQAGMIVTAIRPPTVPVGTARIRITLSAQHTKQHIDQLISACEQHVNG